MMEFSSINGEIEINGTHVNTFPQYCNRITFAHAICNPVTLQWAHALYFNNKYTICAHTNEFKVNFVSPSTGECAYTHHMST